MLHKKNQIKKLNCFNVLLFTNNKTTTKQQHNFLLNKIDTSSNVNHFLEQMEKKFLLNHNTDQISTHL